MTTIANTTSVTLNDESSMMKRTTKGLVSQALFFLNTERITATTFSIDHYTPYGKYVPLQSVTLTMRNKRRVLNGEDCQWIPPTNLKDNLWYVYAL